MKILAFSDYYLPGYKGGGPVRTLSNTVDKFGGEFCFKIVTRDRDLGDLRPYKGVVADSWHSVGKAEVLYLSPQKLSLRALRTLICATERDVMYFNSFFSPTFTIKPLLLRRLGLLPQVPVILAPRGEFSPGALAFKSFKKRFFLALARNLGLYQDVIWQVSSEYEKVNVSQWFGDHASAMVVAPNIPISADEAGKQLRQHKKVAGNLKIVFLSRISRMKNLDGALKLLNGLEGNVHVNIYGPLEDEDYWAECQRVIRLLPQNIRVVYAGSVALDQVVDVLAEHDLFFLPTKGENFGHVILEALLAGCPVLISDQTPWRGLQAKGVGWDLPLNQPQLFRDALQQCVEMDSSTYEIWSHRAQIYGVWHAQNPEVVEQNRKLFCRAAANPTYRKSCACTSR